MPGAQCIFLEDKHERRSPEHKADAGTQHYRSTQTSTRDTNKERSLRSPSTTSQPPPGMGLIYMGAGDRVEEDINHGAMMNRKWRWWLGEVEIGIWYMGGRNLYFLKFYNESGPVVNVTGPSVYCFFLFKGGGEKMELRGP